MTQLGVTVVARIVDTRLLGAGALESLDTAAPGLVLGRLRGRRGPERRGDGQHEHQQGGTPHELQDRLVHLWLPVSAGPYRDPHWPSSRHTNSEYGSNPGSRLEFID